MFESSLYQLFNTFLLASQIALFMYQWFPAQGQRVLLILTVLQKKSTFDLLSQAFYAFDAY